MAYSIISKCIGCGLCKNNCVVYAIEGEQQKVHTINEKRCIECSVCVNVCPVHAIVDGANNLLEPIKREDWGRIVIDKDRCSACSICTDSCSFGALQITNPTYRGDIDVYAEIVDIDKCVSCGLCVKRCPLKVISLVFSKTSEVKK